MLEQDSDCFFAEVVDDIPGPSFSDDWVPGLNLLGGIRGFVTDSIALFFEYKFNYAKFNWTEGDDGHFGIAQRDICVGDFNLEVHYSASGDSRKIQKMLLYKLNYEDH